MKKNIGGKESITFLLTDECIESLRNTLEDIWRIYQSIGRRPTGGNAVYTINDLTDEVCEFRWKVHRWIDEHKTTPEDRRLLFGAIHVLDDICKRPRWKLLLN